MLFDRFNIRLALQLCASFFVLTLAFQNCSQVSHSNSATSTQYSSNAGNGDAYSGKPGEFRHFDLAQSCAQKDRAGKPLPNDEIFFQTAPSGNGLAPFLVRRACEDIAPQALSASSVRSISDTAVQYNGATFSAANPPGDFDVVASSCPAGSSEKTGVSRTNLMVSAQDWTRLASPQGWYAHQGIGVSLNGSINSLPGYMILRNDAGYLDEFRRASQHITLQASTSYVFSFLGKAGSVGSASFRLFRDTGGAPTDESLTVQFNFLTGVAQITANTNIPPAQVKMIPVANGFLCTVYFTTSATGDQSTSDVGVSPTGTNFMGQLGDSIFATDAQLERVGDFCQ